jgi:hypothetical protein
MDRNELPVYDGGADDSSADDGADDGITQQSYHAADDTVSHSGLHLRLPPLLSRWILQRWWLHRRFCV